MESPSASAQIRDMLLEEMSVGALVAGQKLPTERELAGRFGVSRTIVRDALTFLEAENRVSRHVGKGTFVTALRQPQIPDGSMDASPVKLIEARQAIESELAALAVMNATEADLRKIAQACSDLENASSLVEFERLDGEFHAAIAEATHNELLYGAYRLISQARDHPEWQRLKQKRHSARPARRHEVYREHRLIMEALTDRDAIGARSAMLQHLASVRTNLLGR